jgi:N-acetylneuraminic acid mutarotase
MTNRIALTTLLLICTTFSLFAQPNWGYAPTDDLWDEKMEVQTLGNLAYVMTGSAFKVKDLTSGTVQTLATQPFTFFGDNAMYAYSYAHNNELYFGYRDDLNSYFARYNPANNTWTSLNAPSTVTGIFNTDWTMTAFDNQYFYVGKPEFPVECSRYNISTGTWQSLTLGLSNISSSPLALFVENGMVHIYTSLNEIYAYNVSAGGWTNVQGFSGSYPGNANDVFIHNDTLYSITSSNTWIKAIYTSFTFTITTGFSASNLNDTWMRNNQIYANNNGTTRVLAISCQAVGSINESVSGDYYGNTAITLAANFVGTGASPASFTYTWTDEANNTVASPYMISGLDSDNTLQLYVTGSNGYCIFHDTATIDIMEGAWNARGALPAAAHARSHAVAFALDDYLYFGLGENDLGKFKDFYRYDYNTGIATRIADFPGDARSNSAYGENNGKGYIVGGRLASGTTNEFWEFDPATETWQQLANVPYPSYDRGVFFMLNNSFYVGRGYSNSPNYYRYDFSTQNWVSVLNETNSLMFSFQNYISFAWNGNGYTINANTIRKFVPSTQAWTSVTATIPADVTGYGLWAIPMVDCVMIGGMDASPAKTYLFFPDQGIFKPGPSSNGVDLNRSKPAVCSRNGELYLLAGERDWSSEFSPGTVNEEFINFGSVISVFKESNCNTGSAFLPKHWDAPVNSTYFSFYNSNVPEVDQSLRVGSMVYDLDIEEPTIYETGDVLIEKYASFEGCVDTFSVMMRVNCNFHDDSIDVFDSHGRLNPMMWVADGKYYIGGGYTFQCSSDNFWSYDPATQELTPLAPIPGGCRHFAATFTIGNKLYFSGGKTGNDPWSLGSQHFSNTYEYDIATNTWTEKAAHPSGPIFGHVAWVYDNKAYLVCGIATSNTSVAQKKFYQFDPANNQWTQLQDYPAALGIMNGDAVVAGDLAYVVGGFSRNPFETFNAYNDNNDFTYKYNHVLSTWSLLCSGTNDITNDNAYNIYYQSPVFASLHQGDIYLFKNYDVYKLNLTSNTWSSQGKIANACDDYNENVDIDCGKVQAAEQVGDMTILFTRSKGLTSLIMQSNYNFFRAFSVPTGDCAIPLPVTSSIETTTNELCEGDSLTLSSSIQSFGWNYSWRLNGEILADETEPQLEVSQPGSYTLVVNSGSDFETSEPVVVTQINAPTFIIDTPTTLNLCGGTIDIIGSESNEGFSYVWLYNGGNTVQTSPTWTAISDAGEYQLVATSGSCSFASPIWTVNNTTCGCFGDLNNDGFVNQLDVDTLTSNFGCFGDCIGDMDYNGFVGTEDIMIFLSIPFGACPE